MATLPSESPEEGRWHLRASSDPLIFPICERVCNLTPKSNGTPMPQNQLPSSVIKLIRELFPNSDWTDSQRDEWHRRLSCFPPLAVEKAIRDSYAESSAYPRLSDVLSKLKGATPMPNDWQSKMPTDKELENDRANAKRLLQDAEPETKIKLAKLYKERVGSELSGDINEWTRGKVFMAAALLQTL